MMLNLGVKIFSSPFALKDSDMRHFPVSRHRSKRQHKKLLKRFGGEFIQVPAVHKTPQGIIVHPSLYEELKRGLEK